RRGSVPRSQMKKKRPANILAKNHRGESGRKGTGESHPPKKRLAPSAATVIMFTYSAICMSANFIDEYSVWKPATSSVSASGRSKGVRLTSAVAATRKTANAGSWRIAFHCQIQPFWESTMSWMRNDPATRIKLTKLSPSASSYENIWAEERRPPMSVYLLLAAQPAITIPYTPREEIAKR